MGKHKLRSANSALTVPAPKYDRARSEFENAAQWVESAILKMDALCDRYMIDRDNPEKWFLLSLNLAAEHVPNFAPAPPKAPQGRRPPPEQGALDAILFFEMGSAEREGKSVKNRALHLTKTHPKFKGKKPGTLRQRYHLLKNPQSVEGKRLRDLIAFAVTQEKVAG